ncbi:hypothetical protein [Acetobacter persici]|uniref:hypothetical protein n=1 Tax=Acetobacter persici TaxID=1076596 RepID=UPI001F1938BD|nr:hypothetical protein [Acetobacter persici]MCG0999148.1 hypothetical protein [Acetobacter persici]
MTLHHVTHLRAAALLASTFLSLGGISSVQAEDVVKKKTNTGEVIEKKSVDNKQSSSKKTTKQKNIATVSPKTNESILVRGRRWDQGSYTEVVPIFRTGR